MDFVSVRIITDNLDAMVAFYEKVTGVTADRPVPVFAELHFPSCTLALGHTSTAALFNNAALPAHNKTAIIEWVVDDVDTECERLKSVVSEWEQEPTLMPWGNRSILLSRPRRQPCQPVHACHRRGHRAIPEAVVGSDEAVHERSRDVARYAA
jgi:hypothetical protein